MDHLSHLQSPEALAIGAAVVIAIVAFSFGYLYRSNVHHYLCSSDLRRRYYRSHSAAYEPPTGIEYSSEWAPNSRGMLLFRQQFFPKGRKKKHAVIGLCHGFGDHSNALLMSVAETLCNNGFIVLSMDAEGHGLSDGLHGHVDDLQHIAADFSEYFLDSLEEPVLDKLPFFVYGVSMGGAVVFNLCTKHPISSRISGAIMCAPMVKLADEMKPHDFVTALAKIVTAYIPLAPIAPIPDILDKCIKCPKRLALARQDQLGYGHTNQKPRLVAALAMLTATEHIAQSMPDLSHPILILHGVDDKVTAPASSQTLFDKCSSVDKKILLYEGCWHDMLGGETEEQVKVIYNDIITWIKQRC
jgi:alpha-beta hydrolase superfamily lysophospholipase